MIYINQSGTVELGRGETLAAAIIQANDCGFEITADEVKTDTEACNDGDVYWTRETQEGYNE